MQYEILLANSRPERFDKPLYITYNRYIEITVFYLTSVRCNQEVAPFSIIREKAAKGGAGMRDSVYTEDSRKERERRKAVENLYNRIRTGEDAEEALWQAVIAYQNYPFYTSSGLPFFYTVRRKKNGEYSGELLVSRKEGSKTLTKSSVMVAYHRVLGEMLAADAVEAEGSMTAVLGPPEYKGPKSIGQIFGISYVYSLFWKLGLIRVPEKVEDKLKGKEKFPK